MPRLLLALALFIPVAAGAQAPALSPGMLVRVSMPGQKMVIGGLHSVGADSIHVVTEEGVERAFALTDIGRLERSRGRTARAGARRGAKVGAITGGVASLLFLTAVFTDGTATTGGAGQLEGVGLLVGASMVSGVMYGVVIGAVVKGRDWRAEPLPSRGRLSLSPARDRGVAVRLAVTF